MKTTFKTEGQNYVMTFEGRLDTSATTQTDKDMQRLYDCEGHDIILDCHGLEFISSSGLRLFLRLLKQAKSKGSQVCLTGLTNDLRKVFDETGFTHLFKVV